MLLPCALSLAWACSGSFHRWGIIQRHILEEVVDFIEFLESKKKRISIVKEDPLTKTIGVCECPSDLAEKHNKYVYK